MTKQVSTPAKLGDEDKQRMERLCEEVEGRLQEMVLIASRTIGKPLAANVQTQFRRKAAHGSGPGGVDIEIVCTPEGCVCYDYRDGTCSEC